MRVFDVCIIIIITLYYNHTLQIHYDYSYYRCIAEVSLHEVVHLYLLFMHYASLRLSNLHTFRSSLLCECLIYKHRSEAHKLDFRPPAGPILSVKYRWSSSQPTLEILLLTQSRDCQRD